MRILGIESSCDETAMAVVDIDDRSLRVVSSSVSSSMQIQKQYGGVVPEVAARRHIEYLLPVLRKTLEGTPDGKGKDLDLIAVTRGPGLATSLAVGVQAADMLSLMWGIPAVGVNHLEGHVLSPFIEHDIYPLKEEDFPVVILTVSGGHSMIILMNKIGEYQVLGDTIDDAAGEAFDKVAKMLGLPYPGGPQIDKLAARGNPEAFTFPRALPQHDNFNFSFSGVKTSVKYAIRDLGVETLSEKQKEDVAASFQRAVVDALAKKTMRAAKEYGARTVFLAGGVGANSELRARIENDVKKLLPGSNAVLIDRRYSGDNAVMIAVAGYFQWLRQGKREERIEVHPKLSL